MQLSPPKTPSRVHKIARAHSHSFQTLTSKHTRRSSNTQTKQGYSIADLFIRKARHLPPEHHVVDVEKGFAAGANEDTEVDGEERESRLVYIAIGVFATLGMGAWVVSLGIATGVVNV
jgi:hypothetical protein